VAGTLAATQAGGPRSVTGTSGPATPAPPGAAANAATDAGNAEAHPAPSGAAGAAPPQNKGADAGGQTGIAAQALPSAQPGDQAAGGSGAAPLETLKAGGEPSQRVADAPPPGHSQNTTASTAFANELRLSSTASPLTETAAGRTAAGPVVEQVAVQISRAASGGQDKLTIDLRPAVLGRVSVSLELGHDHRVIAVISADRPDTLDLLQRDARLLERALQDAGLKTDSGSLSFSLNGDGTKEPPYGDAATADQFVAGHPAEDDGDTPSAAYDPYARAVNATGIDIHV
jgi:flagellar hook-length control protein FliK